MAITFSNSANSFVRFGDVAPDPLCIWGNINYCLPVYEAADVNFQIVAVGTESEIDALILSGAAEFTASLVTVCDGVPLITFSQRPSRYRLSATQMLYNWEHGLPGFTTVIAADQCFKIQITLQTGIYTTQTTCSNCFERITDACFTSVLDFTDDSDSFGYKYCFGGDVASSVVDCTPTIIEFTNQSTLSIPYTAQLKNQYGDVPVVQVWIYVAGVLNRMDVQTQFDTYPPTVINLDFAGPASGVIVIR